MTNKEANEFIKFLSDYNNFEYNLLKLSEELSELDCEIKRYFTKPPANKKELKEFNKKIVEESGDVKYRLEILVNSFGKELVDKRIIKKLKKLEEHYQAGKYKHKL